MEEWVEKRKAKMSFTQFINNLIDETFEWDYENRYQLVKMGLFGMLALVIIIVLIVYYVNRDFLHKAKLL